jgi:hypothetical protein
LWQKLRDAYGSTVKCRQDRVGHARCLSHHIWNSGIDFA